jgi:hypothetical protein
VQEVLAPLAGEAKRSLQSGEEGGGGPLDAMAVWKRVNEALELLQAMAQRPRSR